MHIRYYLCIFLLSYSEY